MNQIVEKDKESKQTLIFHLKRKSSHFAVIQREGTLKTSNDNEPSFVELITVFKCVLSETKIRLCELKHS